MTLANPNCKGNELSKEIDNMNKAYRTFWLWIITPIEKISKVLKIEYLMLKIVLKI